MHLGGARFPSEFCSSARAELGCGSVDLRFCNNCIREKNLLLASLTFP